jgi:hypothetical protein
MSEPANGIVINLNAYGATVRLDGGGLATAPPSDVEAHRAKYQQSLLRRTELNFELRQSGRRPTVVLLPPISAEVLDERIAAYLQSTQEWDERDGAPSAQRHFLHKKRRAELFRSQHES